MAIGKLWAGRIFGTNTGNVFMELEGDDTALTGLARLNDNQFGVVVYHVTGIFDGTTLSFTGKPAQQVPDDVEFGNLTAEAKLNPKGELEGKWSTEIGTGGMFHLFPHKDIETVEHPEHWKHAQLHTARHNFGAVDLDRSQITALAEQIQADFKQAQVVVTVEAGVEQSRFLNDFKTVSFQSKDATVVKIQVQEQEGGGINRVVVVEFGPHINNAMTQGADEAWVLGMLEKVKRNIQPFERTYTTHIRRLGFGINQVLFVGALIYLPSFVLLQDRVILMLGVVALIFAVDRLHKWFLPFAALRLYDRQQGIISLVGPSAVSWIIAFSSAVLAGLLGAYLQGASPFGR